MTRSTFLLALEVTMHIIVLMAPLFFTGIIHNSDSLLKQVPLLTDNMNEFNITGFGLRDFSLIYNETNEDEDIKFSDEQQDTFGSNYRAAHITYHVFQGIMILSFIMPFLCALINRWYRRFDCLQVGSKLAKSLANVYIPLIVVTMLLMIIPFWLLTQSGLCGPNYIELGFTEEVETMDDIDQFDDMDDHDHHYNYNYSCVDLVGSYAIVHDDIPSTCEIGASGIGYLVSIGVWSLVLMVQTMILRRRGYQLELEYQLKIAMNGCESDFATATAVEMDKATFDDDFSTKSDDDDDSKTTTSSATVENETV